MCLDRVLTNSDLLKAVHREREVIARIEQDARHEGLAKAGGKAEQADNMQTG